MEKFGSSLYHDQFELQYIEWICKKAANLFHRFFYLVNNSQDVSQYKKLVLEINLSDHHISADTNENYSKYFGSFAKRSFSTKSIQQLD